MRLLIFYLTLLLAQGLLTALLAPLPAPDLFLVAVLSLLWRVQPWQLVLAGFGVGLLQDAMGHGLLGLHAYGLAGAALAASMVRAQLTQSGFFERLLIVLAAVAGKWVVLAGLLLWTDGALVSLAGLWPVALFDAAFTVAAAAWLLPWADALLERARVLRKELL